MKILWMSNAPWAPTGYGQQTAQATLRLKNAGHDVAILGFYGLEGAMGYWEGMNVYPTDHTKLGKYLLPDYARHHGGGSSEDVLVMTLMDLWVLTDKRFGGVARTGGLNMASWIPVDHDPVMPKLLDALQYTQTIPIAMSQFGRDKFAEAGIESEYAPHAIDTQIFQDRSEDRDRIRYGIGIPEDKFVIGMVANNQGNSPPRKAFPQVFQAFARFLQDCPDAMLYLHTDVHGFYEGLNLLALAEICGIPGNAVAVVDQFKYRIGEISQPLLAHIYSCMDVLVSPSYGEGFGIPIIESQACGTPVIVTDWTAMPELVSAGWKVQGDAWYNSSHGSFFMCPSVMEIVEAFEQAYEKRGDKEFRAQAREGTLKYDCDVVFEEHWLPILDRLEGALQQAKASEIVIPNREERRAIERASRRKTRAKK